MGARGIPSDFFGPIANYSGEAACGSIRGSFRVASLPAVRIRHDGDAAADDNDDEDDECERSGGKGGVCGVRAT